MTTSTLGDDSAFAGSTLTFVNRCRVHGISVCEGPEGFRIDSRAKAPAAEFGLVTIEDADPTPLGDAHAPRIAIYSGTAIGYPYWAYYAHALLSIGLCFTPVDGADILDGALDDADLLIMPGGFATWGLDRAEGIDGIDAKIAAFIRAGGAYLGSCGGAFYMSDGRPGWLGAIDAMPKFTQEYLLTGAAMVGISLDDPVLGRGLPERLELPYYHGPVYAPLERTAHTLGHFRTFISESRLFIDNPLSLKTFEQDIRDTPAILANDYGAGKVLIFSPHPEMGEYIRKAIAIDSYVRTYAPIRGVKVMDETLRFYTKEDCAGYRLIHNAIARLGLFHAGNEQRPAAREMNMVSTNWETLGTLRTRLEVMFSQLEQLAATEAEIMQEIASLEIERLRLEWNETCAAMTVIGKQGPVNAALEAGLTAVLQASLQSPQETASLAETLALTELPIRLTAAALRIVACDRTLKDL